jgi:pumilio homology domain family member 6
MPGVEGKRKAKRPAPTQAGPVTKKSHVEQPDAKGKKRSQPVTAPLQQEEDEESSGDEETFGDEAEDGEDATDEFEVAGQSKDPNGAFSFENVHQTDYNKGMQPLGSLTKRRKCYMNSAKLRNLTRHF